MPLKSFGKALSLFRVNDDHPNNPRKYFVTQLLLSDGAFPLTLKMCKLKLGIENAPVNSIYINLSYIAKNLYAHMRWYFRLSEVLNTNFCFKY